MIKRLRIKFVCIIMLIATVMLAVIFGMVLHFTESNLENQSIQMLQAIREDMFQPGRPGEPQRFEWIAYILVTVDHQGNVLTVTNRFSESFDQETIMDLTEAVRTAGERSGILEDWKLRYLRSTAPFGERIVFSDASWEREILGDLIRTCAVIGFVSFVVFLGLSFLLAAWVVKPVEKAWNQQRQFVADASHELKTPLTVILTNAELMQDPASSDEDRSRCASSILTMSHQMRGLVEGLLDLARVDNGALKMTFTELDFSSLTGEELLPFEPVLFENGLELDAALEPGIRVKGSESHLRQVLNILLDNARKYSMAPGVVQVSLKRQSSHCLLSVSSPGEEISRKDLKNIFKRFYRIDKARAMNHSYGLGLSIAESLVREHKGKIWAESQSGRNTFFVQLPILLSSVGK